MSSGVQVLANPNNFRWIKPSATQQLPRDAVTAGTTRDALPIYVAVCRRHVNDLQRHPELSPRTYVLTQHNSSLWQSEDLIFADGLGVLFVGRSLSMCCTLYDAWIAHCVVTSRC